MAILRARFVRFPPQWALETATATTPGFHLENSKINENYASTYANIRNV